MDDTVNTLPDTEALPLSQMDESSPPPTARSGRLLSLDVFRGVTIAGMLLVNNGGKGEPYAPLEHAPWNGWTPTDLVFPFFLFIVGVAIPFSLGRRAGEAQSKRQLLGRIWLRTLALFMVGALIHGFAFAGVALTFGQRDAGTPFFTLGALPDGFVMLKVARAVAWAFVPLGLLALLVPLKNKRAQVWAPLAVTLIVYLLMFAVVFANRYAWNHGLSFDPKGLGNGIFRPDQYRIPGILQRIAICYGVAATLALFVGPRLLLLALIVLLAAYSALMLKAPFPGHTTGSLTREDNLERSIDVAVFDRLRSDGSGEYAWKHTYSKYPDPEGLLSTLPAICTALLGVMVGRRLRGDRPAAERCARLLAGGVIVTLLGAACNAWLMPINKSIWTPSFVLFCGGFAMLGLGTLFYIIDVRGRRWWTLPLVIYGMNAIAAFVAAAVLVRVGLIVKIARSGRPTESLVTVVQDWAVARVDQFNAFLQQTGMHMPNIATPANHSLAYAILFVLAVFLLMAILYVCRIFVKV